MKKNGLCRKLVSVVIAVVLLSICLCSCSVTSTNTLMSLGKTSVSINTYELLLSRLKGNLAYSVYSQTGQSVTSDTFWDTTISMDGTTYNTYFSNAVLNNLKQYLIAQYLFDEVYNLTLPDSYIQSIDANMEELVEYDGDGSKTKLNAELSNYGVNYKMLRDIYIMESKLDYLLEYLYGSSASKVSDSAKQEFFEEKFVCFKQVFLANYKFVTQTDANGDIIYYNEEGTKVLYDTVHGTLGSDGVYYLENGHVAYDTENGYVAYVDKDGDGYNDTEDLSAVELIELRQKVDTIVDQINEHPGDVVTFEYLMVNNSNDSIGYSEYQNGYFLCQDITYKSLGNDCLYLDDACKLLFDMNVGETTVLQSDYGYHIIMKYELPAGAYSDQDNEVWFENDLFSFSEMLCDQLFYNRCTEYMDSIIIYDDVMKVAPDMKSVNVNYYY